jgi:4-hydroxy-3-methylbut-2-enyl diphosphate reductase IspH
VERAIAIVERALEKFGAPIYVKHEIVHTKFVCDEWSRSVDEPNIESVRATFKQVFDLS